jgi:cell division protein FtsN
MGAGRHWKARAVAVAALAVAAPALAQRADTDGPLPTARYERPPRGVDPSILNRPAPSPEPASPPAPTTPPSPARPVVTPAIDLPELPTVRRRESRAPDSLETTTAAPRERPWERPRVGMPGPSPRQAQAAPPPPEPRAVRTVELQIGAFADRTNAERAARAARLAGPTRIQSTKVAGVTYHRVIVGPGAETAMRTALSRLGFREARALRGS